MIVREILDHRGHVTSMVQSDTNDPSVMHHILREDHDPMIRECAMLSEQLDPRSDWKPVAQIPAAVVQQMMQDGSWDDEAHLKKWLNDHANKPFRIWQGRV